MEDLVDQIEKAWHSDVIGSHWDKCYLSHRDCAIALLIKEVRRLRSVIVEQLGCD